MVTKQGAGMEAVISGDGQGRKTFANADNKAYEYFFQKMWRGKRCQVGKGKIEKRLSVMCLLST